MTQNQRPSEGNAIPSFLTQEHYNEWVVDSGVAPIITELGVRSLDDPRDIDELLNRNNDKRWKHWEHGPGWSVCGVDPLTGERVYDGAQFKPDVPVQRYENGQPKFRRDGSPDLQKYFSASGHESVPLFLDTGVPDYWLEVLHTSISVLITEGPKKAGAGLTVGFPTISLPGVSNGQRKGRLRGRRANTPTMKNSNFKRTPQHSSREGGAL